MDNNEKLTEIRAETVTLLVTDAATGKTFSRELPIDYLETANGLRLKGEDLNGRPSELVFFSDRGLSRLRDLTGAGADHDMHGAHLEHE